MNSCDIILIGHAGDEARTATTQSGNSVSNFSIAYNVSKDKVIWFRCVCWNDHLVEICGEIKKGASVKVIGRITSDHYFTNDVKVPQIEITCDFVKILPKYQKDKQAEPKESEFEPEADSDLPF